MTLKLRLRSTSTLPLEFPGLSPDRTRELSLDEISAEEAWIGREKTELGELFTVRGNPQDERIEFEGDLSSTINLGAGMSGGEMRIEGNAGDRLGSGMRGGLIEVNGSAGCWAGVGMRGGLLRIIQDTGDHLAGAEPGERRGMCDGNVLVHGSCGAFCGEKMRAGLIAVLGSLGEDSGRGMIAGSIFGFGSIGPRAGLGMKRGTIAAFWTIGFSPAPTFAYAARFRPPFATIYLKHLRGLGFPVPDGLDRRDFYKYNGDRLVNGQGEILVLAD